MVLGYGGGGAGAVSGWYGGGVEEGVSFSGWYSGEEKGVVRFRFGVLVVVVVVVWRGVTEGEENQRVIVYRTG